MHEAKGLPDTDRGLGFNLVPGDLTDPFVSAYLGEARIFKTRYVKNQTDPHWNESFSVNVCHHATSLEIKVIIAVLSRIYWLLKYLILAALGIGQGDDWRVIGCHDVLQAERFSRWKKGRW